MTATIIFVLLFGLMLTGMPVSISLGLTVLAFLFAMTQVPIESVALKLFTGIERFEIMAIPFFILAGNFLTHGGVARRMINFATVRISAGPIPRVVSAGVPRRKPLVTNGFSGSPGIMFLLVVMPALPSAVSATLPVSFLGRRSQSMRCVSVPPATRRSPPSRSPWASACALSRIRC